MTGGRASRDKGMTDGIALTRVGDRIAGHLNEIKRLFKPGVKVTVLVRTLSHPDGTRDLVMTDDTIADAIKALSIREST